MSTNYEKAVDSMLLLLAVFVLIILILLANNSALIVDLQRRVGQLEQKVK